MNSFPLFIQKLLIISTLVVFTACGSKKVEKIYTGEKIYNKPQFTKQEYVKIIKRPTLFNDLNSAITELGNQILINNIKNQNIKKVILTSFVNLSEFKKTSTFGRASSESMINELHIRNFRVLDFRGQDYISINENGEYFLTRDTKKLKEKYGEVYILVGTYSKFDQNSISINARLMNIDSGEVISTGRVIYLNGECELFDLCEENKVEMKVIKG